MKKKKIPKIRFDRSNLGYALAALEKGPVILTEALELTDVVDQAVQGLRNYLVTNAEDPMQEWTQLRFSYEFKGVPPVELQDDPQEDEIYRFHGLVRNAIARSTIPVLQKASATMPIEEQVYTNMAAPNVEIPCPEHVDSNVIFSALGLVTEQGTCFKRYKKPQMSPEDVLIIRGQQWPNFYKGSPDSHWVQGPFQNIRYSHAVSFSSKS